jgi:hypothetical protein
MKICKSNLLDWPRFSRRVRREYRVFQKLLGMVPHLEERIIECSNEEAMGISDLVRLSNSNLVSSTSLLLQIQKGVSSARSDE